MKKQALFALILLSSALFVGGCSLLRVAGPPCVGNSCPAGASGQLPTTVNAANTPAPDSTTQAKNTDAPSQHRSLANRLHITHGQ
ncbi:MAG TPA: hypothetical protein VK795_06740 [Terriglobales bacterium]|nr:hypothetical protein [Terriglobales bacterium]